jgi:DNA-binding MarR family transcriptional regulator
MTAPGTGPARPPGPHAAATAEPVPATEPVPTAEPGPASEPAPVPELLSRTALTAFRLNGQFLAVAEGLAGPAGLTAAWWQVLGAVLPGPLPVAGIARAMGITRQSVQRIADLLVGRGLAEYRPNPAHRRAKLLALTDEGLAAMCRIRPQHHEFARRLCDALGGEDEFAQVTAALEKLSGALTALEAPTAPGAP